MARLGLKSGSGWPLAALLVALACAAGCARSLEDLGTFPCAGNHTCPVGWECSYGDQCIATGTDASGRDAGTSSSTRACESHDACDEGGKQGACVATTGGGSACSVSCTGMPGGCGTADCKLVSSGVKSSATLVAACVAAGSGQAGTPCDAVEDCAVGYTCFAYSYSSSYTCIEMCSNYNRSCSDDSQQCWYGMDGLPTEWALCY